MDKSAVNVVKGFSKTVIVLILIVTFHIMPIALILDDQQERHDAFKERFGGEYSEIVHVYNFTQFFHYLMAYPGRIDYVSLDHDLGDRTTGSNPHQLKDALHGTGMNAVQLLETLPFERRPKHVNVHSHNYVRGEIMHERLCHAGYVNATYMHFTDD